MNVDISVRKVSASKLVPQPVIRLRRASDGEIVTKERVLANGEILPRKAESGESSAEDEETSSGFHWKFICNGAEVPEEQVKYFKIGEDGKESETRPFDATAEIKVIREVSASGMNTFLVESIYELFAPTSKAFAKTHTSLVSALYQEAERYLKEDLIGLCLFSWGRGGFKQYYGVLYPIISGDQFEWVLKLTQTKIEYLHLMDIPMVKVTAEEKPPTLQMLPPIEALIG